MHRYKTSRRKAHAMAFAVFLVGVGLLFILRSWWPGIALVVGLSLAVRQYLLASYFAMGMSLFIFTGIFVTEQFHFSSPWYMPLFLIIGGLYVFFREFFGGSSVTESESEEDLNHEIEENREDRP
ncbi:MAG: hypothetical protein AAGF04_04705 [Chlamydiota bacterium]